MGARKCHISACKLILNKIKCNKQVLKKVLSMKNSSDRNAVETAMNSGHKNREKCAKLIMSCYDKDDAESIFLACLQLSDLELAKSIWNKTNRNKELQNKL